MQQDTVVAMTASAQWALRKSQDAEDRNDQLEADRWGRIWVNRLYIERDTAPTSNAGAKQKLLHIADLHDINPWPGSEAIARSARRLARKVGRGEITPLTVREMRALMPACRLYDSKACSDGEATSKALAHTIDWCARLRLI
jgi:hypothetical protein